MLMTFYVFLATYAVSPDAGLPLSRLGEPTRAGPGRAEASSPRSRNPVRGYARGPERDHRRGEVAVGHTTLIGGEGNLEAGKGPIRTGVTAILPRGQGSSEPVFAGVFSLNGNGEMTGTQWVEESGSLEGPVMITNTHSVGVVRDAVIAYQVKKGSVGPKASLLSLPLVAETWDGYLNDINGFHIKPEHVFAAWAKRAAVQWRKEMSAAGRA